jgi:uncharacterized protein with NRDE domain
VCLLVALVDVVPGYPLVVAANRDERLDRPAVTATVLRRGRPRVLGGRDLVAGGTWLAVNEHGVVAGLTNRPVPGGSDPARRSRGSLPLALARHTSAERAVRALADRVHPADYNPCWLLAGDRRGLWYLDLTGAGNRPDAPVALGPGVHVLENRPIGERAAKAARVEELLAPLLAAWTAPAPAVLVRGLGQVLADHQIPGGPTDTEADQPLPGDWRPAATAACCVHTEGYGTRSAAVIAVGPGAAAPWVHVADGPPCVAPLVDVGGLWHVEVPAVTGRGRPAGGRRPPAS